MGQASSGPKPPLVFPVTVRVPACRGQRPGRLSSVKHRRTELPDGIWFPRRSLTKAGVTVCRPALGQLCNVFSYFTRCVPFQWDERLKVAVVVV